MTVCIFCHYTKRTGYCGNICSLNFMRRNHDTHNCFCFYLHAILSIKFTVCSEDGGNKFLQKIYLFLPANMALHSSRQYTSRICFVMYILNDHGISEVHHAVKISGWQKKIHPPLKYRVILVVLTLLIWIWQPNCPITHQCQGKGIKLKNYVCNKKVIFF